MTLILHSQTQGGGRVVEVSPGNWWLEIPSGPSDQYRLAQIDDYAHLQPREFYWQPPVQLSLRARVSAAELTGTWGFGFWNTPFTASLGLAGTTRRLPTLPNAAWFFFAGRPNHLAFWDNHPAQGFLAATFRSVALPGLLLAPGILAVPLLLWPATARLIRRMLRLLIREDGKLVLADPTAWHDYLLLWEDQQVVFKVDGGCVLSTPVVPCGKLGMVIWIDNQYVAFPPDGRLRMGSSSNPQPTWLEINALSITQK